MKYKVWFGKGQEATRYDGIPFWRWRARHRGFDTVEEATRYADFIFRKTGLVVAVTVVNK